MRAAKYERLIGCCGGYSGVKHHVVYIYIMAQRAKWKWRRSLVYITSKYLCDKVFYIGNLWRCDVYTQVICTPWTVFMGVDTVSHILAQATRTTHTKSDVVILDYNKSDLISSNSNLCQYRNKYKAFVCRFAIEIFHWWYQIWRWIKWIFVNDIHYLFQACAVILLQLRY